MSGPGRLRRGLGLGTAGALVVIAAGLVRFPLREGASLDYVLLTLVVAMVVGGLGLIGWRSARPSSPGGQLALRRGTTLGLALGGLWITYILVTHLFVGDAAKATLGQWLTWATFAVTLPALLLASALSARSTRSAKIGLALGLWAGGVAGVLACAATLLMLYIFMGFLAQHMNSGELHAFATSGWRERETWFFWEEEFTGAAGYLVVELALGAALGGSGGLIGRALAWFERAL